MLDLAGQAKLKGTNIEYIELQNVGHHVSGAWEAVPGSWITEINDLGPTIVCRAEQAVKDTPLTVETAVAQPRVCYIPTISALDIDKPPEWLESASDDQLQQASAFEEVHVSRDNRAHGDPQWAGQLIERVKEGPPS